MSGNQIRFPPTVASRRGASTSETAMLRHSPQPPVTQTPDTPRVDLRERKRFAAEHDPWAARVKAEAESAREMESARRQRLADQRAQHRAELDTLLDRMLEVNASHRSANV